MAGQISVDMELKKAFSELQSKMIQSTQQIKVSDMQIETLKRGITHSKLVLQELTVLPNTTRIYEGVGRMFILQPADEVRKHLEDKISTHDEKIKTVQTNKTYLEKNIKESEDNLRELVLSKRK
ncbi:unnamed protein product [Owenia fusiformis]|uniref:Prefoldin subunit 1 n=1 Tax=Owenia fusiformis TaxID=6347 RepID=A0A8S4PMJ2_OWEFU|nr:unnamed protein product [Owenia fusiformis]